jgi:hypothetical protein
MQINPLGMEAGVSSRNYDIVDRRRTSFMMQESTTHQNQSKGVNWEADQIEN